LLVLLPELVLVLVLVLLVLALELMPELASEPAALTTEPQATVSAINAPDIK
jgi:Sec-independent protein translocase protein TatA